MRHRRLPLCTALLLFLACPAVFAADGAVEGFYEFARRGASGLVEEEDLTDEFYYIKTGIKLTQKTKSGAVVDVKYQYYEKDYDNLENIDNSFNTLAFYLDAKIYSRDDLTIKIGPDLELKEKEYKDSKNKDYDQAKFEFPVTFKGEGDWKAQALFGINSYHYPNAPKDELKLNSKIDVAKKFFDSRLEVSAFYRYQWVDRQKLDNRIEKTYGAAAEVVVEKPLLKAFSLGVTEGMDNTIIYEDREDSYDYKYTDWHVKTRHEFLERIKVDLKYASLARQYADFDHNYNGFLLENGWKVRAFQINKTHLDLKLTYMHKQFRYPYVSNPFAFYNDSLFAQAELARSKDWKVKVESHFRFYNYPADRKKDKIYYIEKVGIEKRLWKDTIFTLDYRYTYKNFLHKMAITENSFRFGAKTAF